MGNLCVSAHTHRQQAINSNPIDEWSKCELSDSCGRFPSFDSCAWAYGLSFQSAVATGACSARWLEEFHLSPLKTESVQGSIYVKTYLIGNSLQGTYAVDELVMKGRVHKRSKLSFPQLIYYFSFSFFASVYLLYSLFWFVCMFVVFYLSFFSVSGFALTLPKMSMARGLKSFDIKRSNEWVVNFCKWISKVCWE